ncbi:guanine nucleotide binding protein, alpha subunit [Russula dissimulans]|nr:guanine nucleotide binding protein, alpha subunit [Russula dissimulans]
MVTNRGKLENRIHVSRIRSLARTVPGMQECHYLLDTDPDAGPGSQWVFYDVGYPRTEARRVSWIRYLMEANALVFLASLSVGFDQFLEDDRHINRLEDTYLVWTGICKSRLISEMHLILVPSGCDDLGIKLERGICLNRYITSYGDRPNDLTSAIKYFRAHFKWV